MLHGLHCVFCASTANKGFLYFFSGSQILEMKSLEKGVTMKNCCHLSPNYKNSILHTICIAKKQVLRGLRFQLGSICFLKAVRCHTSVLHYSVVSAQSQHSSLPILASWVINSPSWRICTCF